MRMLAPTPALPLRDVALAAAFYRERLGFDPCHLDRGFGIMQRDEIENHLWEANRPGTPGAEPRSAGSASYRLRVEDGRAL